ncbi:MAG: hypothetical protein HY721_11930 [Planctomycetes bacterium]|nr:hypothetical protein [Planctomycetota bacterium]
MIRLPGFIAQPLSRIGDPALEPRDAAEAALALLEAERRLEGLSRAVEAFREAARSLGLLDEARSGQGVYDAWSKLSRFFLAPVLGGSGMAAARSGDLEPVPPGFEALGARWERTLPEVEAFVAEERQLDRALAEAPVGSLVAYRYRARLLVLDRRAERIKVALDLVRRDLTAAARAGLALLLAAPEGAGGPGRAGRAGDGGPGGSP